MFRLLLLCVLLVAPIPAAADLLLPPGFTSEVYVTGDGVDQGTPRGVGGIPSVSTLAFDRSGVLYLARTGRRYVGGQEVEDVWPIYRIPLGGARLTATTEPRFFYGPPLPNPQVGAVRADRELFVTTFDRERKIGVLYRMVDGTAELFAGGTPPRGTPPVLRQPEGVAIDDAGNVFVVDRQQGVVLRLDPSGRVVDPEYVKLTRPRVLALDGTRLWVGADGPAEAPWLKGPGEIWRVEPGRGAELVRRGPMPAAMAVGPGGRLYVADRQAAQVFMISPDGSSSEFARFTEGDAPRGLGFAPVTPETRQAGIAGDLFVVVIRRNGWPVNEVLRVTGPFDRFGAPR
jgi:DNA-binding beta-propeller fold protein YncE